MIRERVHAGRMLVILLVGGVLFGAGYASAQIVIPSGRHVFFQDEEILLRVSVAAAEQVAFVLRNAGGMQSVHGQLLLRDGHGYLRIPPNLLAGGSTESDSRGHWVVEIGDLRQALQVMHPIRNTPFTIAIYGGSIPNDDENAFGGPGPMPVSARQALYRDKHGVNLIMHTGHWGGPAGPEQADRVAGIRARTVAQHIVAGQHQPAGISTSWADPGIVQGTRLKVRYHAQLWRRHFGGGFTGVHYADEPGLTWGIMNEEGDKQFTFSVPADVYYAGPFAVPQQYLQYELETGRVAPDFRDPDADLAAWMDFMLWRTTILGRVFAQYTEDVHAIDPDYIGFSQIYAWRTTADGIYPPDTAKGVDVLATHGYGSWTYLGHANPAHEVDAMRSGAWDKPLWMLGPWLGNQSDDGGLEAVLYGVLARKVEGIIWPLDWLRFWDASEAITQRILPISGMLYGAEKPRDAIGILHSRDQHIFTNSRNVRDINPGTSYFGHLLTTWWALQAAGHPTSRVVEGDLFTDVIDKHAVLVAPNLQWMRPAVQRALEAYIARGGRLLLDASSSVEIAGAEYLPFAFKNGLDEELLPRISPVVSANTAVAYETLIAPILPQLKAVLQDVPQPFTADSPHVLKGVYAAGEQVQYYWAVNQMSASSSVEQTLAKPLQTALSFPFEDGVLYDVFAHRRQPDMQFAVTFEKGEGRLYAHVAAPIGEPLVQASIADDALLLRAIVQGESGPLKGILPLAITITSPAGEVLYTFWRATDVYGRWEESLPWPVTLPEGRYTITVRETISQHATQVEVAVADRTPAALDLSGGVAVLDREQLARFLDREGEILVLYGTPEQQIQAENIAAALQSRGRDARTAAGADFQEQQEIRYDGAHFDFFGGLYNTPTVINRDVIVLGSEKDNEAMRRLVEQYRLVPFALPTYGPHSGMSVLWWATAAFGLEYEIVAIYAADADSLETGVAEWLQFMAR